jgi:enoyl-CoA hydratase
MRRFDTIKLEFKDRVLTVWLDRPPVNALNDTLIAELTEFFQTVADDEADIRAIIVAGKNRHFCAGGDLKVDPVHNKTGSSLPEDRYELGLLHRTWTNSIYQCKIPIVAAVHGACVGGGMSMASLCDFIVAAEGAYFGMPEINVGRAGGSSAIRRIIPMSVARWMVYSGEMIGVERLAEFGSVLAVVPASMLMTRAQETAALLARQSPRVLRLAKEAFNQIEHESFRAAYDLEHSLEGLMSDHPDGREALASFMDKRAPTYSAFNEPS